MKRVCFCLFLFSCVVHLRAQNLVENGGFEEYTICPTGYAQVESAVGWSILTNSPDYMNRCNTNDSVDVPSNVFGYQNAYEGDAYMGGFTYHEAGTEIRESYQHALSSPLIPGIPVFLSMMVSPGCFGNLGGDNSVRFTSNGIGMKFSMEEHNSNGVSWEGNVAIYLPTVLSDTANWTHLSGSYIPDSSYGYIEIGSFLPDKQIELEVTDSTSQYTAAYAFVDNVCVSTTLADCQLAIGMQEMVPALWNIGSNPVGNELRLRLNGSLAEQTSIELYDGFGRLCLSKDIPDGITEIEWNLSGLTDGSYFVHLRNTLGHVEPIHIMHLNP